MTDHEHAAQDDSQHPLHHDALDDHDLGLSADLPRLTEQARRSRLGRRGLLGLMGGLGVAAVAGCASDSSSSTSAATATDSAPAAGPGGAAPSGAPGGAPPDGTGTGTEVTVADGEIPEETAGPYPGDGSNGPDVLSESGIVRSDLTTSFGSASGVAEGVPVTVKLKVYDLSGTDLTPMAGAAVYLWHCDREGRYSLYDSAIADENFLRGVQAADAQGRVEFTTIFPACYSGRWPHMHFEVYQSLADATTYEKKLRTSQLALPQDVCETVYATDGYDASVSNLAQVSLDSDNVFSDGYSLQLANVSGSVEQGYTVSLNVPV